MDGTENEIGLFEVSNYLEHSKSMDNIAVICLGILLLIIWALEKREVCNSRIKSYVDKITTAN